MWGDLRVGTHVNERGLAELFDQVLDLCGIEGEPFAFLGAATAWPCLVLLEAADGSSR
jgi:hypothetical protein